MNIIKFLFFIIIVLPFNSFSQSLISDNILWGTMDGPSCGHDESDCRSYYTKINGDTLIDATHYKFVMNSGDSAMTEWTVAGFIRQDNQKYFFRKVNGEFDCLLYDFGCSENDTLNLNCWCLDSKTYFLVDSVRYSIIT